MGQQLTEDIERFLAAGGKITYCPDGNACWPDMYDPLIDNSMAAFVSAKIGPVVINYGRKIDEISNEQKLIMYN